MGAKSDKRAVWLAKNGDSFAVACPVLRCFGSGLHLFIKKAAHAVHADRAQEASSLPEVSLRRLFACVDWLNHTAQHRAIVCVLDAAKEDANFGFKRREHTVAARELVSILARQADALLNQPRLKNIEPASAQGQLENLLLRYEQLENVSSRLFSNIYRSSHVVNPTGVLLRTTAYARSATLAAKRGIRASEQVTGRLLAIVRASDFTFRLRHDAVALLDELIDITTTSD